LVVVDDSGEEVVLDLPAQRIVSLAPSNTEVLFAMGLGDKVVGVTDYCNYPPEAMEKESVGGYSEPDLEMVVSLDPDLVVTTSMHAAEVTPALKDRELIVVTLDPTDINGVLDNIYMLGKLTGMDDAADDLVQNMQASMKEVTDGVEGTTTRPRTLYVVWPDPLWTTGSGTFAHEIIEMAGGENIAGDLEDWATMSLEAVVERNPEVIVVITGTGDSMDVPLETIKNDTRLATTDALKNDRVYQIDGDLAGRPGPRLVEALHEFARFIHPEVFQVGLLIADEPVLLADLILVGDDA
jgi:iron complex transport system substrate-binding protein